MSNNLIFAYLAAVWEVTKKVRRSPNKLRTLKRLSKSERFIMILTLHLVVSLFIIFVETSPAF